MLTSMLRRAMLPLATLVILTGTQAMARSETVTTVTVGEYLPSSTPSLVSLPLGLLDERKDIQEKHGIRMELTGYSNLSALYSDLGLGRIDVSLTGPSTLAALAAKGAPLSLAGTVARATNAILSNGKPWTVEDLRGSRLVAQTSSSSWIALQAIIERNFGLTAGEDYNVVNSDSTAAAALQLAAGKTDYAVVRAEQVILALKKFENVKMVASPEDLGREQGTADWGYIITYNRNKHDYPAMERFMAALAEVSEWIDANPDEVERRAVAGGQEPGVAKEFLTSGLFKVDIRSAAEARESLRADYNLLREVGYLETDVPDTVFPK